MPGILETKYRAIFLQKTPPAHFGWLVGVLKMGKYDSGGSIGMKMLIETHYKFRKDSEFI
jgi:hypothetical protein